MTNKSSGASTVTLGGELTVSAIGFGAMASTPARVEENLASLAVTLSEDRLDALHAPRMWRPDTGSPI